MRVVKEKTTFLNREDLKLEHKNVPIEEIGVHSFCFLGFLELLRSSSFVFFVDTDSKVKILKTRYVLTEKNENSTNKF